MSLATLCDKCEYRQCTSARNTMSTHTLTCAPLRPFSPVLRVPGITHSNSPHIFRGHVGGGFKPINKPNHEQINSK